jgi:hypothetical protein
MNQARVYCKSEAGFEEVQSRHAGLNARTRQLLILVDGKRNVAELGRMMAVAELEEFLALLELKGLIFLKLPDGASSSVSTDDDNLSRGGHTPAAVHNAAVGRAQPAAKLAISDFDEAVGAVALAPQVKAGLDAPGAAGAQSDGARVKLHRLNMSKLLQATVGPMADDLCVRIERASRHSELADLFMAAITVVELMSGRKAANKFVEKMKQMGWE